MNPATVISLCTIRLECSDGVRTSVGTGFLFQFNIKLEDEEQARAVPMIITNKHVVSGYTKLSTTLTLVPDDSVITDSISVNGDSYKKFAIEDLKSKIFNHPDPDVDIAAFSFHEFGQLPEKQIAKIFSINENFLLTETDRAITRAIESIVMVGYPNGLWDSANNRPISRRGITASHPLHAWNGEKKFLIDAACFPGSSGSPVFQFEDGVIRGVGDEMSIGSRVKFLGILFAGPLISQEGRIEQRAIPTSATYVTVTESMMNLGFVAHADVLHDFVPILKRAIELQRLNERGAK